MRRFSPLPMLRIMLLVGLTLGVVALQSVARVSVADAPPAVGLLDGTPLDPADAEALSDRPPVAVMIDNLPEGARPQIGLDRADLVYEFLVEGGITRFMAVYLSQDAAWIEPVRSARTPALYLAKELDAVLGHVGAATTAGPTDATSQMSDWGVRHIDEGYDPDAFWRDPNRAAPHNAATDTYDLRAHAAALGWTGASRAASWLFKDEYVVANLLGGAVGRVSVAWAPNPQAAFAVDWYYDGPSNSYVRWMAGRPHRDGLTGAPLTAKNVILQYDSAAIVNGEGHVLYGSLGEGQAYVFLDGQVIEAVWSKRTREDRTRYWDRAGNEIAFDRGATWVELLPYGSPLDWE